VISSDDENVPPTRIPHSPEVILVFDPEEEMNIRIKQENPLSIKMEDSDSADEPSDNSMDTSPLRQARRVRQPSVDMVFLSEDEAPKWPQDYYVCDIAKAFKQPPQGLSKKAAFGAYFPGLSFKKSTFYDNYNLWIRTPRDFRMKYADYGRTEKGSWKHFLAARAKHLE
jgi:hypothetical protein